MTRGRKPVPTRLKVLRGNPGKRPLNEGEPRPDTALPVCPKHLDKLARREWKRVSAELHRLGLLTRLDRAALAAYCQSWSAWVKACEQVDKFGSLLKKADGSVYTNPYVHQARAALRDMHSFAAEFGMTPSSRTRLKATPAQPADPFEAFLSGQTAS